MRRDTISIPKVSIHAWDWLLIVGLILAPMTGLRVWKVGPAEVLVLVWCLKHFPRVTIHKSDFPLFFAVFLGSMALGTVWGLFVAREEVVLSGWATWIYILFVSLGMYEGLTRNSVDYNERLLRCFASLASVVHILLYVYARMGNSSIFGAPLWYYYRYSGGGTNPHQIAILMCALVFLLAREVLRRRGVLWNLFLAFGCVYVLLETESATAIVALVTGTMVEIILVANRPVKKRAQRIRLVIVECLMGLLLLVVLYNLLYRYAYSWIASDSNGLGRFQIFSNIKNTFVKSPFFGLGPGVHSRTGRGLIEYHNTYLEVLAASGLVGFIALFVFSLRLLKLTLADNTFLPVIVSIYVYSLAGFAMRRLVYWGVVVFVTVICSAKKRMEETRLYA
jgi:O-antigen ligase